MLPETRCLRSRKPESAAASTSPAGLLSESQEQQGPTATKTGAKRRKALEESVSTKNTINLKSLKAQISPELPMAQRGAALLLGAHVSAAGGLHRAFDNARSIGAKSFALFVRNQRRWESQPLDDEEAAKFRSAMLSSCFLPEAILPHGSYLINCASPNAEVRRRSCAALVDEMDRCRRLGLVQYNLHPGSAGASNPDRPAAIARLADSLAAALAAVPGVCLVLENAAGQGGCLGGSFAELGAIVKAVCDRLPPGASAESDSRLGVCIDTCHAFAYGYDLRSAAGLDSAFSELAEALGHRPLLRGLHLNDSRSGLASRVDRHADIGDGQLGADAFRRLLRHPAVTSAAALRPLPMVLETPGVECYAQQLQLLRRLQLEDLPECGGLG